MHNNPINIQNKNTDMKIDVDSFLKDFEFIMNTLSLETLSSAERDIELLTSNHNSEFL